MQKFGTRGELKTDCRRHWAAALMWRYIAAMGACHVGDRERVDDAAERHRLGLEDVDPTAFGQGEELADRVVHLARSDRD